MSPQCALFPPYPDSGLTYIQRSGWERSKADGSETRPAGSGGLYRSSPELWPGLARQGLPCITSHPGCSLVILISVTQRQKKTYNLVHFCFFSLFHVFSWRRQTEKVKNNSQTLNSCVTSSMKAFFKYPCALGKGIWC